MYLTIENGVIVGMSNIRHSDEDVVIPDDANYNDYIIVDGEPIYDSYGVSARDVRMLRNRIMASCDWTQLPDVSEATKLKYQTYRQALRDITKQDGFPYNVTWPTQPEV